MTLKIIDYPIEQLQKMVNPKNPRWMPEQQMDALRESITTFGLVEPLIVNTRTNQLVGGHQRVAAATAENIASLPVVLVDLDPTKEISLNLLLNKVRGEWDYEKLAVMLSEMDSEDLGVTGFTDAEAESIAASLDFDLGSMEEDDESGVVREIRNRTEEEVKEELESTEKVQFGMFSKHIPTEMYDKWVEKLVEASTMGTSPAALGLVIASRLGIDTLQKAEDEDIAEDFDEDLSDHEEDDY